MIRLQVRCDDCAGAWAYPPGDFVAWLREHGWLVNEGRHTCPRCARRP